MLLALSPESRILIDVRATGILRAIGHDPTLVARPEPMSAPIEVGDGPLDLALDVRFATDRIETPPDLSPSDRERMQDNLRGDVLQTSRFPWIEWRGRYAGTREGGRLNGDLALLGAARPVSLDVRVEPRGQALVATGAWSGRLTELGIKPFRALMGALRLEDWVRIRLESRWEAPL
jgi:hypothetical protein